METDLARRRLLIGTLALLAAVGGGLILWVAGGFPLITSWYRSADTLTQQLPENDPDYMYACALQYQHEGNTTMAVAAARRATIASPSYAPAHSFLAAEALQSQDFAEAARECRSVLNATPNNGAAELGLANAYRGMGETGKAEQIYRDTLASQAFNSVVRDKAKAALGSLQHTTAPPTAH